MAHHNMWSGLTQAESNRVEDLVSQGFEPCSVQYMIYCERRKPRTWASELCSWLTAIAVFACLMGWLIALFGGAQ